MTIEDAVRTALPGLYQLAATLPPHYRLDLEALIAPLADSLPRQPTLPTLEAVSPIEPTGDPKGYASVLVQEINTLTGRNFKVTDDYTKMARTLIKEKIPLEQARQAIKAQHAEWGNDPKWGKYVRPSTMLRASNMKRYVADLEAGPVKRQAAHTFKQLGD